MSRIVEFRPKNLTDSRRSHCTVISSGRFLAILFFLSLLALYNFLWWFLWFIWMWKNFARGCCDSHGLLDMKIPILANLPCIALCCFFIFLPNYFPIPPVFYNFLMVESHSLFLYKAGFLGSRRDIFMFFWSKLWYIWTVYVQLTLFPYFISVFIHMP